MTTRAIIPNMRDFERNLRAWIASGSGLASSQVIPAEEENQPPAPQGLYASVQLITPVVRGLPFTRLDLNADDNLEERKVAVVRDRYSVQWHRAGATDAARLFTVWASSAAGLQAAAERDFVFHRVGETRTIDEIISGKWEERALVEVDVGYSQVVTQEYQRFDTINVELRHDDGPTATVEVSE